MNTNHGSVKHLPVGRWCFLVLLHVLAAPVYVVRFVIRTLRTLSRFRQVAGGAVRCPHCSGLNQLDLLATCRRCGVTEFGSRLRCMNCGQTNAGFACDSCGAFIRVL
jgi:hypothetical protein